MTGRGGSDRVDRQWTGLAGTARRGPIGSRSPTGRRLLPKEAANSESVKTSLFKGHSAGSKRLAGQVGSLGNPPTIRGLDEKINSTLISARGRKRGSASSS